MTVSPIYQRGTISLTNGSKIVTGVDTNWLSTDIRPGDIFRVGSAFHFVESRDGLTQLTLDTEFAGTTATGLAYSILRMSGDWGSNRFLAIQVAEYVRNFHADTLTNEALTAALAQIEEALALITTTQFMETAGIPAGATGNVGDWAIDPETGEVWKKTGVSTWTAKGNFKGTIGADGATIHIVSGAPASGLGKDGDIAIHEGDSEMFQKVAGTWGSIGFFVGAIAEATAAKDAAVAAKTASEAAAAAALGYRDTSETNKNAAQAAKTAAETAQGAAESASATAVGAAGTATTKAAEATAAAAVAGGYRYTFDPSTTNGDPGAGKLRINAANTSIYISKTDKNGAAMDAVINTWDDSSTTALRGTLKFSKVGSPGVFKVFSVTSGNVDSTNHIAVTLSLVVSNGAFADGDDLAIEFSRTGNIGTQGNTGATGPAIGVTVNYSTTVTDADPGNGIFRFDSATLSAVTKAYIDDLDSAGVSISAWLNSLDDSTSASRGYLTFRGITQPGAWASYKVTGNVVDGTGYRKINLTYIGSGGTWANGNSFAVSFSPTGDAGTGSVNSVNGEGGDVVLTTDDISDTAQANKWSTATEKAKLANIAITQAVDLDQVEADTVIAKAQAAASKIITDYLTVTAATNLDTIRTAIAALGTAAQKNTGTASGNIPLLDGSGKLDTGVLPALAITDTFEVASQAAMLALTAEKGDVAVRSDLNKSFILKTNSPNTLADWVELRTPTDAVLSVAGQVGAISVAALVAAITALRYDQEDQVVTGGARVTPKDLGNLSGASITPDPGDRAIQKITNNGAGSILPGSNTGQYTLEVVNTTGAGAVTTTGWTLKGDSFDTTITSVFICSCIVTATTKLMSILKVA